MKGPIRSLEFTYVVHATEDPEKLAKSVERLISMEPALEVEEMEGHYGNPIKRVRAHITGEDATKAFQKVSAALGREQTSELLGPLGPHLDEHSALFIRFDKQRFVSGSLRLGSADSVRLKVKPRPFLMGGDVTRFYADLFGE